MCIACRTRNPQNTLIRLKHEDEKIVAYDGIGRSFYLCDICANNEKKIKGLVKRFKQNEERFIELLKELTQDVNACSQFDYIKGVDQ